MSSNPLDIENMKSETSPVNSSSPLRHRHSLDPLGLRHHKAPSPIQEQREPQDEHFRPQKPRDESNTEDCLASTENTGNPLSTISSAGQASELPEDSHHDNDGESAIKDEDEEILEDEDMLEGDGEGDGEGDATERPQTAAERTAQRRKMKRFR